MTTGGSRIAALIVAAGSGSRAGGGLPKQYRKVAGKAVLAHAIDHLRRSGLGDIRTVIGADHAELFREAAGALPFVIGGGERQASVRNGLEAIAADGGVEFVLIHDAARPFVPRAVVERLLAALETHDGAVPALGLVDTLARGEATLGETVPRDGLLRVQTPQAFRFEAILAAHHSHPGTGATDDAQIARAGGLGVAVVRGDELLDKLTYEEDFARAEERLGRRLVTRTGLGFDVHAFAAGRELWLGGILVPHDRGLAGHSDADVVLHAITDAILGAIGAGDIGDHFPPSDPQWRGAASSRFLEHALALVESAGGILDHVDVTIIAEEPRIGPHRQAMREHVAGLLRLPVQALSIKATTTERLGFTGRGEGMAAQAIATVRTLEDL
jgi:2-C-methyl-D-erythritol 4-phosphate cytidylyltransferase/2-C-methyl-D-erythritol 2,4-cyclodiphosphate synthase